MAVAEPSIVTVADVVTSDLNAAFPALQATRQNVARVSLEDMETPVCVVVPGTKTLTRTTRDQAQRDYQIEIGLFQRIDDVPHEEALTEDQVISLAEEILEWWIDAKQVLTGYDNPATGPAVFCHAGRLDNDEPFSMSARRTDNVMRVLIQLDFKVI